MRMESTMTTNTLYLSRKHNIVPKEDAKWKVIHKYDNKGDLVEEVWVDLKATQK